MKKINLTVGCKNYEMKPISKPLIRLIISIQKDIDQKVNKNKTGRNKKNISFVYATLELSKRLRK